MNKTRALMQGLMLLLISPIGCLGAYGFGFEAQERNVPIAVMLGSAAIAGLSLGSWLIYSSLRRP